jgi:hypothetical protein
MAEVPWLRYPRAAGCGLARAWLQIQANLGLAANTLDAYARAVDDYFAFSAGKDVPVVTAVLMAVGERAILAGPWWATPPTFDGGAWTSPV